MIEIIAALPPVALPTPTPATIREAVAFALNYTRNTQQMIAQLGALRPIPLAIPMTEYGL